MLRLVLAVAVLSTGMSQEALHASPGSTEPALNSAAARPDFSNIRQNIEEQVAAGKFPSLSIAVSRDGLVLWEESFGNADNEHLVAATNHTPYYLASVTKSFTAIAILMLRDEGRLALDHGINEYLGPAKLSSPMWDVSQATVARILTHTGGLTTYARFCYGDEPACRIDEDQTIRRYGIVFWPPGDHFDYSNLDYGILGDVVVHVSKKSLGDFYRERIFGPLGMGDCFLPTTISHHTQAATGYSDARGRTADFITATPGASGAYCSVNDLIKFGTFALKKHVAGREPILSDASVDQMEDTAISMPNSQGYGLGWWINNDFYGYRGVLAQGGTDTGQAWLQLIPTEGLAVAVLSNKGSADIQPIVNEVIAQLLPAFAKHLTCSTEQKSTSHRNPPSYLFNGKWKGAISTYKGNVPLTLDIDSGGRTVAYLGGKRMGQLSSVRFRESRLIGQMPGALDTTEDTGPHPYDLYVELYLNGNSLTGTVTTTAKAEAKYSNQLSYWVRVERQ